MTRQSRSAKREQAHAEIRRRQLPLSLPHDILDFLLHYPFLEPADDPSLNANLKFYQNRQAARPRRAKCEELQDELRGNWDQLEWRHDFVQWFFPIREQGVNWEAQPLQPHEVEGIKADPQAMARLLESYRIMLAFYGLRLVDETTGELVLEDAVSAPSPASYLRRFHNLESNSHNFLRITRILKCLGEFGLTRYPPSFLLFILTLQSSSAASDSHGPHLSKTSLLRSFDNYWRWCIRDDDDRRFVVQKTDEVRDGTSWTTEEYRQWIEARAAVDREPTTTTTTLKDGEEDSDEAELIVTPVGEEEAERIPTEQKEEPEEEQAQDVRVASVGDEGSVAPLATNGNADGVEEKEVEESKVEDDNGEEKKLEEMDVKERDVTDKVVEEENVEEKVVEQKDVEDKKNLEPNNVEGKDVEDKNAAGLDSEGKDRRGHSMTRS